MKTARANQPYSQAPLPRPPALMDETPTPENPPKKDFNKLDLSQLQGFSFGTQWSQEKTDSRSRSSGPSARDEGGVRREGDRRDFGGGPGGGGAGAGHRDRRGFRKPAGGPESGAAVETGERPRPEGGGGGRPYRDDRAGGPGGGGGPRREGAGGYGRGEFRGGPRRDGGDGDFRGGGRFGGGRPEDRGPYISPIFNVTFYPEDSSFAALSKTIRNSCRTFELFDIAKTVIGKPERFVVVLARKAPEGVPAQAGPCSAAPAAPAGKGAPLSISVPDSLAFESDDAAIAHVLGKHMALFFDAAEVEIDPPKGNFQIVNKCGVTGELLGPPNYHRYNQIVQQHYAARIKGMPFEAFRGRIESLRDPESIAQWMEKMKKTTRYTWKQGGAPVGEGEPPAPIIFDSLEEARTYLLTNAREKVVRSVETARFHGTAIELLPPGEVRRAVEGALERQRRFPLDTANALRGRLRREGFTIFKKGSKGISYVCAVKRKFRVPGQTFAESIGNLITFIEAHPMVRASELPTRLLGIQIPATPPAAAAPAAGEAPPAAPALTPEEQNRIGRLQGDLRWLVTEGYVTEFLDGRLFAPPPMVEARKKEIESAEHDPENFPETPPAEPAKAAEAPVAAATDAPSDAEAIAAAETTTAPVADEVPETDTSRNS